ncbi:MAG: nucleoside recognition domain-containing protein [Myxococcota bacterium]|nr:nucleoside recognition domain-containing protein [Myxococcota bacterium]
MDKIFFAIIAMAFFFAGVHTFDHNYLSAANPSADQEAVFVQGSIQEGFKKQEETCLETPEVVALGSSRWDVLAKATVTPSAQGWDYSIATNDDVRSLLAFCKSKKRAEGVLLIDGKNTERKIEIVSVPEPAAEVGKAALAAAKGSVELSIGLIGYIALFLGLMKIVEEAGGLRFMARMIRPLMVRLFPDIPADHPAMGAIIMNVAANALGLGNAATPFGLKAMKELNEINPHKGTATNAMCLFLAINTSGLALLPTGIIGLRDLFGSTDPAAIFPTTLMATGLSTIAGITAAKFLSKLFVSPPADPDFVPLEYAPNKVDVKEFVPLVLFASGLFALVSVVYTFGDAASAWIMPGLIFGMVSVGFIRKVPVYKTFVDGAKEGFQLGVMIIPYLVAILSAIAMFRASGGLAMMVELISPITELIRLPGEALPLALLRPLSGSGAYGITAGLIETYGPDSYIGQLVSTMNGSTETTFYVLAVYFGSVGVNRYRHALWAGITADAVGVLASILAVNMLLQ